MKKQSLIWNEKDARFRAWTPNSKKLQRKLEQKDSYWLGKFGAASKVRMIDPKSIKES